MYGKFADATSTCLKASITPPAPAIAALMPNASSFVRATLMPAAAAARSLARTERKRRPSPERRRLEMATAMSTSTTISKMTKPGFSFWARSLRAPMSRPKMLGRRDLGRRTGDEAGQLVVVEVDLLDRDRRGDRDDGQLHAADAYGGQTDQQPDEHGDGDAGEGGERPWQAGSGDRR